MRFGRILLALIVAWPGSALSQDQTKRSVINAILALDISPVAKRVTLAEIPGAHRLFFGQRVDGMTGQDCSVIRSDRSDSWGKAVSLGIYPKENANTSSVVYETDALAQFSIVAKEHQSDEVVVTEFQETPREIQVELELGSWPDDQGILQKHTRALKLSMSGYKLYQVTIRKAAQDPSGASTTSEATCRIVPWL